MMSDNTSAMEATGASEETTQASEAATKTFTQEEVNAMIARAKGSVEKKYSKVLEDLGDIDELRNIRQQYEVKKTEDAKKRGDFDKLISDLAAKKDAEIAKRDAIIRDYRLNTPLMEAASRLGAVNAEQVRSLLANQVRLTDDGEVEVVDGSGQVRYSDQGKPLGIDELVNDFLAQNSHFRRANPATTNTKNSVAAPLPQKLDITKLDMNNPDDRARYKEYRRSVGLR